MGLTTRNKPKVSKKNVKNKKTRSGESLPDNTLGIGNINEDDQETTPVVKKRNGKNMKTRSEVKGKNKKENLTAVKEKKPRKIKGENIEAFQIRLESSTINETSTAKVARPTSSSSQEYDAIPSQPEEDMQSKKQTRSRSPKKAKKQSRKNTIMPSTTDTEKTSNRSSKKGSQIEKKAKQTVQKLSRKRRMSSERSNSPDQVVGEYESDNHLDTETSKRTNHSRSPRNISPADNNDDSRPTVSKKESRRSNSLKTSKKRVSSGNSQKLSDRNQEQVHEINSSTDEIPAVQGSPHQSKELEHSVCQNESPPASEIPACSDVQYSNTPEKLSAKERKRRSKSPAKTHALKDHSVTGRSKRIASPKKRKITESKQDNKKKRTTLEANSTTPSGRKRIASPKKRKITESKQDNKKKRTALKTNSTAARGRKRKASLKITDRSKSKRDKQKTTKGKRATNVKKDGRKVPNRGNKQKS